MPTRPHDTDEAAWSAQRDALRRMGGPARLRAAVELSETARELRLAGIEARNTGLTRREAVVRLVLEDCGVTLPARP